MTRFWRSSLDPSDGSFFDGPMAKPKSEPKSQMPASVNPEAPSPSAPPTADGGESVEAAGSTDLSVHHTLFSTDKSVVLTSAFDAEADVHAYSSKSMKSVRRIVKDFVDLQARWNDLAQQTGDPRFTEGAVLLRGVEGLLEAHAGVPLRPQDKTSPSRMRPTPHGDEWEHVVATVRRYLRRNVEDPRSLAVQTVVHAMPEVAPNLLPNPQAAPDARWDPLTTWDDILLQLDIIVEVVLDENRALRGGGDEKRLASALARHLARSLHRGQHSGVVAPSEVAIREARKRGATWANAALHACGVPVKFVAAVRARVGKRPERAEEGIELEDVRESPQVCAFKKKCEELGQIEVARMCHIAHVMWEQPLEEMGTFFAERIGFSVDQREHHALKDAFVARATEAKSTGDVKAVLQAWFDLLDATPLPPNRTDDVWEVACRACNGLQWATDGACGRRWSKSK